MSQSLRQIKSRIVGIQNTKKITRAMEMVSMAKLKALQNKLSFFRNYFNGMERLLADILPGVKGSHNQFIDKKDEIKNIILCIIASDTGLCGSYNYNMFKVAENFLSMHTDKKISLVCVGKKTLTHFRKSSFEIINSFLDMHGVYHEDEADNICRYLLNAYMSGEYDEVYVGYTRFESGGYFHPITRKFLNIEPEDIKGKNVDYIADPSRGKLIEDLLPVYIYTKFRMILFSSFTSEHSSRVIAMKEANDNAKEMLDSLILLRNKVRQANITGELIEVISSADALKG